MSRQEWVVIASFANRRAAEQMLAALGRNFRRRANKGQAEAFVITGNADGSLKLRKSRVLEAGGFASTIARVAAFVMVGLIGIVAMVKGVKGGRRAAQKHESHVGSDEHRAHSILAQAGPDAAITLVRCRDAEIQKVVATGASNQATYSWSGPMEDFLAALEPGSTHDWVRAALDQPLSAKT